MEMIPLISGLKAGPLGLVNLPRVWLKARERAAGVLPAGYHAVTGGNDARLLEALGLGQDAFNDYISTVQPSYQACEGWVVAHATDTSPGTIARFNAFIDAQRGLLDLKAKYGVGDDYASASALIQLDDWDAIHAQLLAPDQPVTPVIPAISSSSAGPLGVPHLPRTWLKHRLHGVGRLPEGYRHGSGGFDEMMTTHIGLDPAAFGTYVETERPDYLTAEAWVRANATKISAEEIAAWNERLANAKMPDHILVDRQALLGISDPAFNLGIPMNDLDDWLSLHKQLLAAR